MSDNPKLTLHSNYAYRLIEGRKSDPENDRYPIYGLLHFAAMVNAISNDAKQDNPFACWFLIRIENKFQSFKEELEKKQSWINELAKDGTGIDYKAATKETDANTISVSFATPHAWNAMRLLKQLDSFFLQALALKRVGLIDRNEFYQSTRGLSTLLLSCFHEATLYTSFKLTRDQINPPTDEAKSAFKLMGVVPGKVLSGEMQPQF